MITNTLSGLTSTVQVCSRWGELETGKSIFRLNDAAIHMPLSRHTVQDRAAQDLSSLVWRS